MTAIVSSSLLSYSTPAVNTTNFRSFVSVVTGMLSQSGLINTNASGSIDPTTVSASSTANQIVGYQVWRFNDSLHNSGYPVFIRLEYGAPNSTVYSGVWINVGFMHNGSGSINPSGVNGVGSTPRIAVSVAGSELGLFDHRICCISGSDVVGILRDNTDGNGAAFSIERTKDINGNSTTDGIVVHVLNALPTSYYKSTHLLYSYNTSSYTPPTESVANYVLANGHTVSNNAMTIGMLVPVVSSSFGYPSRMLGIVQGSALAQGASHVIPFFGTASQYYVSPSVAGQGIGTRNRRDSTPSYRVILRSE